MIDWSETDLANRCISESLVLWTLDGETQHLLEQKRSIVLPETIPLYLPEQKGQSKDSEYNSTSLLDKLKKRSVSVLCTSEKTTVCMHAI